MNLDLFTLFFFFLNCGEVVCATMWSLIFSCPHLGKLVHFQSTLSSPDRPGSEVRSLRTGARSQSWLLCLLTVWLWAFHFYLRALVCSSMKRKD